MPERDYILVCPISLIPCRLHLRELAQLRRALGLGPRGCRFKSGVPDQFSHEDPHPNLRNSRRLPGLHDARSGFLQDHQPQAYSNQGYGAHGDSRHGAHWRSSDLFPPMKRRSFFAMALGWVAVAFGFGCKVRDGDFVAFTRTTKMKFRGHTFTLAPGTYIISGRNITRIT